MPTSSSVPWRDSFKVPLSGWGLRAHMYIQGYPHAALHGLYLHQVEVPACWFWVRGLGFGVYGLGVQGLRV